MDYYFGNPNPNPYIIAPPSDNFLLSDYLILDDGDEDVGVVDQQESQSTETESSDKAASSDIAIHGFGDETSMNNNIKGKREDKRNKVDVRPRITFRTKSQIEIMDDGYKWRKYGKKTVKNSPNPRNYYKCSGEDCGVKKRVERDREDSSYVLTSYDGVHNHETPSNNIAYYSPVLSLVHSNEWTANSCSNIHS